MAIILLVRHGENDFVRKGRLAGRLPGVRLNQRGREQAQELAEKLSSAPIKAIYSSPLERAIETAQPLAEKLNKEIIIEPGLIETDCGDWQGKKIKGLSRLKAWHAVQVTPSRFCFPGGETFYACQQRIVSTLEDIPQTYDAKDLLVCVSHADPIRLAIGYYLGMPLDHFQRIIVTPCSVSALMLDENTTRLLALNYEFSFSWVSA